jgi:signal peptidase complex subunit 3
MHNIWVRLNAIIFFALSVLFAMAILCATSTYFHNGEPTLNLLRMNHLKTLRNHQGVDRALLAIDLEADLRPAFHWNLKQLFVYVVAEYESKRNALNQVVIWDSIVENKEDALINISKHSIKYALIDQGAELRNKTVTLKLQWDHMPFTGRLYVNEAVGSKFTLPAKYIKD